MSEYEYTNEDRRFTVAPSHRNEGRVFITAAPTNVPLYGMYIPNADVPTVAAELLKAAGYDYLAGYIEGDIDHRDRLAEKAEAEAVMKKLQERRDGVIAKLCPEAARVNSLPVWDELSLLDQRAINHILNLEDGASRD